MNHLHALLLLAPLIGAGVAPTVFTVQSDGPRLVRISPQRPADSPDVGAFDAEAWRAKLSAPDLDRREQDFDALARLVRLDPAAREAVERWAREGDGELAWTARLLLRANGTNPLFGAGSPHSLLLQLPDGAWGAAPGLGGNRELWLQDLEPLLGDDFWLTPSAPTPPSIAGSTKRAESFELRSGPDGVHVTVEEETDGKTEKKEYSAATLEELYEQHPELRERVQAREFPRIGGAFGGLGRLSGDARAPRTDVLGVTVRPLPKSEAAEFGLEEGLGLYVERVEPRSIAAALGIQRGHVLIRLNDRELHAAQDITEQLCARQADGEVRVELIDRWGQKRSRTWQPEAADSPEPAAPGATGAVRELRKI
ncbi:MAG: PDZ domain-containing protein [Planctomycetes bacterium]|nr:PDZ domain-containing protein [Planctomycetota bacterium]